MVIRGNIFPFKILAFILITSIFTGIYTNCSSVQVNKTSPPAPKLTNKKQILETSTAIILIRSNNKRPCTLHIKSIDWDGPSYAFKVIGSMREERLTYIMKLGKYFFSDLSCMGTTYKFSPPPQFEIIHKGNNYLGYLQLKLVPPTKLQYHLAR